MINILTKKEIHYQDITIFGSLFNGLTFIATGIFQIKNEEAYPFTIIGRELSANWEYTYYSQRRFTASQMQSLRQTAKNFQSQNFEFIETENLRDIKNLEAVRDKVHLALLSQMTRIYVGREFESAQKLGAVYYSDQSGWFLPPHLDPEQFQKWLIQPNANLSTPVFEVKESSTPVIIADPREKLSVVYVTYSDKARKLANITRVGKEFQTHAGVRAYHHFELLE